MPLKIDLKKSKPLNTLSPESEQRKKATMQRHLASYRIHVTAIFRMQDMKICSDIPQF